MTASMGHAHRPCDKEDLWHRRLGHASHKLILLTQAVTLSHNIPLTPATHPGALCNVCIKSKAIVKNIAHPPHIKKPLELVSMDVMGLLYGSAKFTYMLIIHDTYSSMTWAQGLTSKGTASQEAAWWLSEVCIATHQKPSKVVLDHRLKEVQVDQGKLWSTAFRDLCLSTGVKTTASPTQQHTDNAFAEREIQTIQKIARSLLYSSNMDKLWWPHAISQATFIHNRLAGTTCRSIMLFELFYGKRPKLCHIRCFGCMVYMVLRGSTCSKWLHDHPMVSKHLRPCALRGTCCKWSRA
ncbi:uncharacterized protein UDID_19281 [Ustilago sp. UG-2017a]|nr:uncharacterized protein UDID_19281 [Ustilago sp. UG-2017a]